MKITKLIHEFIYQNMRESLFNNIELDNEIFFNFSDEQKLVYLLNPASI